MLLLLHVQYSCNNVGKDNFCLYFCPYRLLYLLLVLCYDLPVLGDTTSTFIFTIKFPRNYAYPPDSHDVAIERKIVRVVLLISIFCSLSTIDYYQTVCIVFSTIDFLKYQRFHTDTCFNCLLYII